MKKMITAAVILMLVLLGAACKPVEENGQPEDKPASPLTVDISAGKASACFEGLTATTWEMTVIQRGEEKSLVFEGVELSALLAGQGITDFIKIELVASDLEEAVDITEDAKSAAGVFLAWSESGVDETPMRVFPKEAETANLLIRNVTSIVVTF